MQFALQAVRSQTSDEPLYVSQEVCAAHKGPLPSGTSLIPVGPIPPSLRFYMDRPLICIEERQIQAALHPQHAHVIKPQAS
jgi:hypothetical protein